ncbi:MAG TPA: hypothetical protein VFR67_08075 [Pilimelia sp.]|nr:hypothetical protein [Pilimelia sp.]
MWTPAKPARRWRPRAAVVAVTTMAALLAAPAPAWAATWSVVPSANATSFDNVLFGIDALTPSRAWAVGYADTGTLPTRRPVIQRWDGTAWRLMPSPTLPGSGELRDVSAVSATDAWAVGFGSTGNGDNPLIEHWDGQRWTGFKSPPVSTLNYLLDVKAFTSTAAFAVGSANVPGSLAFQTLIQRWNGQSWSVVPSPNPAPFENHLLGVDGTGPADVWAVGFTTNGVDGVDQPLVTHFDGEAWRTVATPPVGSATLQDVVAIAPNNVWAVGWTFSLQLFNQAPYVLHWNGTAWRSVALPPLPGARFYGVTALDANRVYAVGESSGPGRINSLIARWNGTAWAVESTPNPSTINRLYDADAAGTATVWTAGARGNTITQRTLTVRTTNG